jgi:hypothetical protein
VGGHSDAALRRTLRFGAGGSAPTAASTVDDLGRLAEGGLAACTLWLPVAAGDVEKSIEWVAAEVVPQLG